MKWSRYTIISLFTVVLISLVALLFIQYSILNKDIERTQRTMEFSMANILSDLYDDMMYNTDLAYLVGSYEGTENFSFTNSEELNHPLQKLLQTELQRVISLNYPSLDYRMDGFLSNEYGCLIHNNHRAYRPKAEAEAVLGAENHLCFCMILENTLDISMTYTNKKATVLSEAGPILIITFILIIFVLSAFAYMIYVIRKQKKLSDLKRDFINNLTHEFKTPIFSISLAAKSMKLSPEFNSSAKLNSYLSLLSNESKRLQTQVDKVLQMALIDSGNLTLEKKKIDLHASIQKVQEGFNIIIEEKKGSITLNLKATKHNILADETHINNIIYNLIDNAQKYTDKPPKIEITTEDSNEGIILSIKDNGVGIKKEVQRFVFDRFYRVQKDNAPQKKGFGLGLSYVKSIVEAHQGVINLQSEFEQGSEFKIFLPVQ